MWSSTSRRGLARWAELLLAEVLGPVVVVLAVDRRWYGVVAHPQLSEVSLHQVRAVGRRVEPLGVRGFG